MTNRIGKKAENTLTHRIPEMPREFLNAPRIPEMPCQPFQVSIEKYFAF